MMGGSIVLRLVEMSCRTCVEFVVMVFVEEDLRLLNIQALSFACITSAQPCQNASALYKELLPTIINTRNHKMSTLADELLQDFEDSGSEGEENQNEGLFPDEESKNGLSGHAKLHAGADRKMELDGDEEDVDEDEEMAGVNDSGIDVEDEEETKAKVEKMELGGVDDVRSVARLMKTLEPVLEVSTSALFPVRTIGRCKVYIFTFVR
jgi:hypothetical protein